MIPNDLELDNHDIHVLITQCKHHRGISTDTHIQTDNTWECAMCVLVALLQNQPPPLVFSMLTFSTRFVSKPERLDVSHADPPLHHIPSSCEVLPPPVRLLL